MPASSPAAAYDSIQSCGDVLCAYAGEQVSIVDPEDLIMLWQLPIGSYPHWTGSVMVLSGQSTTSNRVVDPRTGARLLDLEGWDLVGERAVDGAWVVNWFTRFAAPGRTYVARLEPTRLRVLVSVPHLIAHCQSEGMVLACALLDGRTMIWRVNPS